MVPDNADEKRFNNTFLEVLCYTNKHSELFDLWPWHSISHEMLPSTLYIM